MPHIATRLRPMVAAAALLLLPLVVRAQSPRLVLVEEATNASCGPCAAQNPTFESYLALPASEEFIIPVVFHSRFPGADVMNAAAPDLHNGRVGYYSITGVPSALVNGKVPTPSGLSYAGAPSDTLAISRAALPLKGTMSPITIAINEARNGTSSHASINVSSTVALTGKKIFTVVVERQHHYASAGTNGEKEFYYVARQMFPNAGTDLTLAAGENKTIDIDYTLDPEWDASQIYLVSFVQDAGTHEVMQAATNRGKVDINSARTSAVQAAGDPVQWSATLATNNPGTYTVAIASQMPTGWTNEVKINGTAVANGGTVSMEDVAAGAMDVKILPSASKPGKGTVTVTITGDHGTSATRTFRAYSDGLQALVLPRDEGNSVITSYYDQGMSRSAVSYAFVDAGDEDIFDLNKYVIVYEVGKWAIQGTEMPKLKSFFDKGGRMFMIGAEIGFGLVDARNLDPLTPHDPSFMQNYLHASYVADSTGPFTVYGATGDPIGDNLSFSISGGVQNQDTPDQIAPGAGAVPAFYYGNDQQRVAGIRYSDAKNRLVYLAFGVEGVASSTTRGDILKKGIAWLLGSDVTASAPASPVARTSGMDAARPNPASGVVAIPFNLAHPSHCTIMVYDIRGERVATLLDGTVNAGPGAVRFDGSSVAAGVYTVVMRTSDGATSQLLTVVH